LIGKRYRLAGLVLALSLATLAAEDRSAEASKHFAEGVAHLQAGRLQEAERELRRAASLDPANAQAHNLLGSIYDRLGDSARAEAAFREAIRLEPSVPGFHNNLGISYLRQNRVEDAARVFTRALELDPQNASAHYNLGLLYMGKGEAARGVVHLERARALEPQDASIAIHLARAYSETGENSRALGLLEELDRHPEIHRAPQFQNLLGTVFIRAGELDRAVDHLRRAAELDPEGADHQYKLALAWHKNRSFDKALEAIEQAIRLQSPPAAEHFLVLGMIHLEKGEAARATAAFERAFEIAPDAEATRFTLATLLRDAGRYAEAVRELERLRAARRTYELDLNLAMTHSLAGDFEKAANLLEGISADPRSDSAGFHLLIAQTYSKLERWTEALDHLERAVRHEPRNPALYFRLGLVLINLNKLAEAERLFLEVAKYLPEAAELYVGLAQARMHQDHYPEALEALDRALAANPNYAEAHYLMGNCFNETNRYAEARAAYERALALDSRRSDFRFSLASVLETMGEEEAAVAEFEKVIAADPLSGDAHYRLGRLFAQRGDLPRAAEHLRRAVEINPRDAQSHYQIALVYRKTGRGEEAEQALQTVEELKKNSGASRAALAAVKVKPVEEYLRLLSP
jgi:tetratricopeptide (TPR) repeat protein